MTQSDLLGPLVDAIETVKQRIADYSDSLGANETRTRLALIDPILQALGWNVNDPKSVTIEYNVQGRRADYALLKDDTKPAVLVEAKSLGDGFSNRDAEQTGGYAFNSGVKFACLTNGNLWQLYDAYRPVSIEDKLVKSVSLKEAEPYQAALDLLLLWRPNIASGQAVEAGSPIVGLPDKGSVVPPPPPPPPPNGNWISLSEFVPESKTKPPSLIRFPGNASSEITNWKSIVVEVVEWLYATGNLKPNEAPFQYGRNGRIGTHPSNAAGKPFHSPHRIGGQNLYVETHASAQGSIARVKAILSRFQIDLADVHLRTSDN